MTLKKKHAEVKITIAAKTIDGLGNISVNGKMAKMIKTPLSGFLKIMKQKINPTTPAAVKTGGMIKLKSPAAIPMAKVAAENVFERHKTFGISAFLNPK